MSGDGSRLVYSSEQGRVCPECGQPTAACRCDRDRGRRGAKTARRGTKSGGRADRTAADPRDGVVRVRRETKGRRGKTVTTITGVPLAEDALRELAGELKRRCGCGGAAKGVVIEIQGDHADELIAALEERGYRVKRAGG